MNDFKLRPTQRSEGSKQHAPALCKALCRKPATKISGNLYALLQMCRKNLTRHVETVYVCAAIRNLWLIYVRTYQVLEGSPKEWQCLIIFEGDGVVWEPWPIIKRNSPFLTLWLSFSSKWYSVGMLFAVTLWTLSLSLSHLVSSYLQVSIWNFLFFFFWCVRLVLAGCLPVSASWELELQAYSTTTIILKSVEMAFLFVGQLVDWLLWFGVAFAVYLRPNVAIFLLPQPLRCDYYRHVLCPAE